MAKKTVEFSAEDAFFMARALRLAKQGQFSTTPNPMVGCVIVSPANKRAQSLESSIIGEGYHQRAGTAHAEVQALSAVQKNGLLAEGATVYVTLEPCSHYGRTPPCANALIKAKIARVVVACLDSNPEVSGNGIKRLQDAGISVQHGLMREEAMALNKAFFTRMRTGKPYIVLKLAASLDGKTALENGKSKWITSSAARQDVQRERALSCAILTGSGTALIDNPRLNVRRDELQAEDALAYAKRDGEVLRVVVDGKNQLHRELVLTSDGAPCLVYNTQHNTHLDGSNVLQVQIKTGKDERHIDLARMLDDLGKRQINRLWVEAGAKLAGALLDAGLVNELVLYIAPKILGGKARELLSTASKIDLQEAVQGHISSIRQVGDDIKITYVLAEEAS